MQGLVPLFLRCSFGIAFGRQDVGHDLRPDAVDRPLVETRLLDRKPEQAESFVPLDVLGYAEP